MKLKIETGPLSVNKCYSGKRFKTKLYKVMEEHIGYLIGQGTCPEGELVVLYIFYVKNYKRADVTNMVKVVEDILVKLGWITDDRFVKLEIVAKRPAREEESMEIEIMPFNNSNALKMAKLVLET
jgi:Holliday junction resolvase RusA-like endonuclease